MPDEIARERAPARRVDPEYDGLDRVVFLDVLQLAVEAALGDAVVAAELDPGVRPMFFRPRGCERCGNTGFTGRRGIYELMLMDEAIGPLVLKSADAQAIKRAAVEQGMDSLRDDGARKVLAGMTTVEEVLAATQEDVEPVVLSGPASGSMRAASQSGVPTTSRGAE